jgi:hypothetical protein
MPVRLLSAPRTFAPACNAVILGECCKIPNLDRSDERTFLQSKSCDNTLHIDAHISFLGGDTAVEAETRALNVECCICKEQGKAFVTNLAAGLYGADGVAGAFGVLWWKDVYGAVSDDELVDIVANLSRKT